MIAALLDQLPAVLPDFTVTDHFPLESNPGDYFAVATSDPRNPEADGFQSEIEWAGAHRSAGLNEAGDLWCCAWSDRGDGDMSAARESVYAGLDLVAAHIMADPTLGVSGLWSSWIAGTRQVPARDQDGAIVVVIIRVGFKARL